MAIPEGQRPFCPASTLLLAYVSQRIHHARRALNPAKLALQNLKGST
jgi:hypothetical protein